MPESATANTPNLGRSDDWFTPPHIIEALGAFDLDPSTSTARPFDTAAKHYTIKEDGLSQPWVGFVWMNPPYSDPLPWMRKMADHDNGIALVFARTETSWFRSQVWARASALLFLDKRVGFLRPGDKSAVRAQGGHGGGSPSVLVGYGDDAAGRLLRSGLPGWYTEQWDRIERPGMFNRLFTELLWGPEEESADERERPLSPRERTHE